MPRIRYVQQSKSMNINLKGSDETKKSTEFVSSFKTGIEGDRRRSRSILSSIDARDATLLKPAKVRQGLLKKPNNPFCKSKLALDAAKMKRAVKEKHADEFSFQVPPNTNGETEEENHRDTTKCRKSSEVRQCDRSRSTAKQRRINLEVLEIIRRTKESILAIRSQASNNDQKTQDASYTGNTLPVTVSVVRGKTVMVSQHIIRQTGSVQEEDIGLLPTKSRLCLNSIE